MWVATSWNTWRATYDEDDPALNDLSIVVDRVIVDGYIYPVHVKDNGYLIVDMN
ncbi:hypothetical protein [Streptomyces sp. NPDC051665]|uniref:hypothetical protein n=1 Tax=Streptomyces sp. NPDC051665 TaxID=3154647 RepID=UPI00343B4E73